jgi:hypothetical protein
LLEVIGKVDGRLVHNIWYHPWYPLPRSLGVVLLKPAPPKRDRADRSRRAYRSGLRIRQRPQRCLACPEVPQRRVQLRE